MSEQRVSDDDSLQTISFLKVVNIILVGLFVWFFGLSPGNFVWSYAALFGFALVRNHRQFLGYVSFVTLLSLIMAPNYQVAFRHHSYATFLETFYAAQFIRISWTELLLSRLAAAMAMILIVKLCWDWAVRPLQSFMISILIDVLLVATERYTMSHRIPGFVFVGYFTGLFCRASMSALIFRQFQPARTRFSLSTVALIFPFFQTEMPQWDQTTLTRKNESQVDQLYYFRLICLMYAAAIGYHGLNRLLYASGLTHLRDLSLSGYAMALNDHPDRLELWVNFLMQPLAFLILGLLGSFTSLSVILNVLGYRMPLACNEPWKAVSFSDFMSRMFHYYSRFLVHFFYIPIAQRTRFLRQFRPLDQLLAVFLAVFLFSFFYHVVGDYWTAFTKDLNLFVWVTKRYLLDSFILGFIVCLSLVLESHPAWRKVPFFCRFPIYLFSYGFFYHFAEFPTNPISVQVRVLKIMFTGY